MDDIEKNHHGSSHLSNDIVHHVTWKDINVTVKDRNTKKPLSILTNANGIVHAGEMLAIMGPSGSGKTTLLNTLAHREAAAGASVTGDIMANGQKFNLAKLRELSSYVEQEDALIGSLTVRETMQFAAQLALPRNVSRQERARRVEDLIGSFGLAEQANTIVGTPIKKGLSGGQKKRLGVASRLVTDPKILFLDEPTSGLDSTLSYEVINFIKKLTKENNLIIIASIHQPSTATYKLFDKVCLLSKGQMCYYGATGDANPYLDSIGYQLPAETNPAEFYLDLINTDLAKEHDEVYERVRHITDSWNHSPGNGALAKHIAHCTSARASEDSEDLWKTHVDKPKPWTVSWVLLRRSWIKAYRDIVAYEIRIVMYLGLAILMGTVFLRFKSDQKYIQPYINAIFFGSAFMSFMAVAYVPAYLEDHATFVKERANGLVGPLEFTIANFIIGLPFLFLIVLLFSLVTYWLTNFHNGAHEFFMFVFWLFLDLLAAESLVVLIANIFPIFVVALAITAFANGLWMCVDGFLVPMNILNPFWKYVFHYIDYQAYVFQGMMVNEFQGRTYDCAKAPGGEGDFQCMFPSELNQQGKIDGQSVLKQFTINSKQEWSWVGYIIAIIVVYRVLGYLALVIKRR